MNVRVASACRLCLAIVVVVATAGRPAAAADEPKIEVHSLSFKGIRSVDAGLLKSALATKVSSRLPWGKKALFDRSKFESDLERIRAFYVDRGFPDARITSFDVRLNKQNTSVDLTITVSEGQPLRVIALDFSGLADVPPAHLDAVKKNGPLKVGQPLDRGALATMREGVVNELRDHGYPAARVGAQVERTADPHAVKVVFAASTGPKSYFGPTSVAGNKEVSDNLIRRELLYKEGDLYRRSQIQESQRKLYDLELFQFVSIRRDREEGAAAAPGSPGPATAGAAGTAGTDQRPLPAPLSPTDTLPRLTDGAGAQDPNAPVKVPMRVTVTESKHRHVQFSAGYGTEEKIRGEGEYRQLNFLGGARSAAVHGKWSSLDKGVRVEFNNPYFFAPRWSVSLNGERWYDDEPAFTSVASGGHAVFMYRPGTKNSFSITLTDEYQSSEIANAALSDLKVRSDLIALGLNPTTGVQTGTINSIGFDVRRSTADNPLNARRGYAVTLHLEQAGRWIGGSFDYSNASADARYYLPLGGRLVVAARGQVGLLRPAGGLVANIPFSKRFFLGGATSLRGWGRFELSPLSGSGLPIGGFSMFEGTIETRMSLTSSLGAVAFLDLGNVWTDAWRIHPNDLRYDVGPGLRYNTPVGPLRVDVGYQLNPIPGLLVNGQPQTRRWRIHFSIGQAF